MRDRLIKLLGDCKWWGSLEEMADYLLANGVIVPPVKVGQTVYTLEWRTEWELKITPHEIKRMVDYYMLTDVYKKTVFPTREEAEAALKGESNG